MSNISNHNNSKVIFDNLETVYEEILPEASGEETPKPIDPTKDFKTRKDWVSHLNSVHSENGKYFKKLFTDKQLNEKKEFDDVFSDVNWEKIPDPIEFLEFYHKYSKYSIHDGEDNSNKIVFYKSNRYPEYILGINNIRRHIAKEQNVNFHKVKIKYAYIGFGLTDSEFIDHCKDFKKGTNLNALVKENFVYVDSNVKTLKEISESTLYNNMNLKVLYDIE